MELEELNGCICMLSSRNASRKSETKSECNISTRVYSISVRFITEHRRFNPRYKLEIGVTETCDNKANDNHTQKCVLRFLIRYRFAYNYEQLFSGLWKMIVFVMKAKTDIALAPSGIRIEYFIESFSRKRV